MSIARYHFASTSDAWAFVNCISATHRSTITDYGIDAYRSVDPYYVDISDDDPSTFDI